MGQRESLLPGGEPRPVFPAPRTCHAGFVKPVSASSARHAVPWPSSLSRWSRGRPPPVPHPLVFTSLCPCAAASLAITRLASPPLPGPPGVVPEGVTVGVLLASARLLPRVPQCQKEPGPWSSSCALTTVAFAPHAVYKVGRPRGPRELEFHHFLFCFIFFISGGLCSTLLRIIPHCPVLPPYRPALLRVPDLRFPLALWRPSYAAKARRVT